MKTKVWQRGNVHQQCTVVLAKGLFCFCSLSMASVFSAIIGQRVERERQEKHGVAVTGALRSATLRYKVGEAADCHDRAGLVVNYYVRIICGYLLEPSRRLIWDLPTLGRAASGRQRLRN